MKASDNNSDLRAARSGVDADSAGKSEIDLYAELIAFSVMTPEQQRAYLEPPKECSFDLVSQATESAATPIIAAADEPGCAQTSASEFSRVISARPDIEDIIRFSGPLIMPHAAWAGAVLALVTCYSCGSKADGRELFCIACGTFLDGTESDLDDDDSVSLTPHTFTNK